MANSIPQARLPVLGSDNTFSLPWLRFFQDLANSNGSIDPAIIAELEAEIAQAELTANTALSVANAAEQAAFDAEAGLSTLSLLGVSALDDSLAKITLTVPSIFSVAGSPIYNVGTLAVSLANQSANLVFAGPASGGAAAPTFRALVAADIPHIVTTVGALPSAATAGVGAIAFVTDSNQTIIVGLGTTAVGGGTDKVPVYSDGTNWIIG